MKNSGLLAILYFGWSRNFNLTWKYIAAGTQLYNLHIHGSNFRLSHSINNLLFKIKHQTQVPVH